MRTLHRIFDLFTKNEVSVVPCQSIFADADKIEGHSSISFFEDDDDNDWDDDDDDDDD